MTVANRGSLAAYSPFPDLHYGGAIFEPPAEGRSVTAHEGRSEHPKGKGLHRPVARALVPAKYGQPEISNLSIEVVENPPPGAYDLRLTTESARSSP